MYIFISSVRFSLFLRVVLAYEFRTLKCPTAHQVTKMLYSIEILRDLGKLSIRCYDNNALRKII